MYKKSHLLKHKYIISKLTENCNRNITFVINKLSDFFGDFSVDILWRCGLSLDIFKTAVFI